MSGTAFRLISRVAGCVRRFTQPATRNSLSSQNASRRRGALLAATSLLLLLAACRVEGPLRPQAEPAALARVTVTGTGLFRVEPRALAALGWGEEAPLRLTLNGAPLAYQRHDGTLYFFLPDSLPARYSNQHTLWLNYGEGEPPAPADPPANAPVLATVVSEQRLGTNEQYSAHHVGDPWFWRTLAAPATETHEVPTPGRQQGDVVVTVRTGGVTKVDHQLDLFVTDGVAEAGSEAQPAGTMRWNGTMRYEEHFTVTLPAGAALALRFEVPESDAGFDMSMLDEVIVRYPSDPVAQEGSFRGRSTEAGVAHFEGLSADALAWQVEPEVQPLPVEAEGRAARIFLPAGAPVVVAERRQAQAAAAVERVESTALPTEGAEYVAIVAPELAEAVEPLLAFHRDEGMSVLALAPQQVYDAYSHGTVDPLAFRALLADAQQTWQTPPRFLLLVGDSTYDPVGNQNELPRSYLPSPFVETVFGGETVSDNVIADWDEDGYPDVALGRLPAQNPEQLATMIRKIVDYSQTPPAGAWRQRVLFTADGREALFQQTSERLREQLPASVEVVTVYPEEAADDAMAQIVPALNEGPLIVNYVGHGSVQQWGRDQLLTVDAASTLRNGERLPIFINMTCLTGLFSHPSQESLAETLLWAQNGGAIAAVAPSSLTLPTNQSALNEALLEELLSPERPPIGEAVMRAKRRVPLNNSNDHDIVATFNLLGDPAIRPALATIEQG